MASNNAEPSGGPRRPRYLRNWLSLGGLVVSMGGLFAFLLLFAIDLFASHSNPYLGILTYIVSPGFVFLGLFLIVLGAWISRRHQRQSTADALPHVLVIDLARPRDRKLLGVFLGGAAGFLLLTAIGSTKTYHYTESVQFCGQACHTPMKPEYTAYLNSPHARVDCTDCHVGPGVGAYVKSKINGLHQLYCAVRVSYHRPIEPPLNQLRPAQETCEQCHWSQRYIGNLDRTYTHFLADETNTPFAVRLILKVGGGSAGGGPGGGVHWHMNLANKVEFIAADDHRQVIPWVRVTDADGKATEYRTPDFKDDPAQHAIRRMDCLDCHNRPAHRFHSPNEAVDHAMAVGLIDPSLNWVKSNSVAVLTRNYTNETEALAAIETSLKSAYGKQPQGPAVVRAVQQIYSANFFPEMKADWRAYPDNLNHKDGPGCFRCHDGKHKSSDGKAAIKASDCNSCHTILAQGSGAQLDKLDPKGYHFFHIDSINEDFSCNNCHTGAFPKE